MNENGSLYMILRPYVATTPILQLSHTHTHTLVFLFIFWIKSQESTRALAKMIPQQYLHEENQK